MSNEIKVGSKIVAAIPGSFGDVYLKQFSGTVTKITATGIATVEKIADNGENYVYRFNIKTFMQYKSENCYFPCSRSLRIFSDSEWMILEKIRTTRNSIHSAYCNIREAANRKDLKKIEELVEFIKQTENVQIDLLASIKEG